MNAGFLKYIGLNRKRIGKQYSSLNHMPCNKSRVAAQYIRAIIINLQATLLILLFFISCMNSSAGIPADTITETVTVAKQNFIKGIEDVGILRAVKSTGVYTQFRGKIAKMVDEGTHVKKGEPVVWLDQEELKQELGTEKIEVKKNRTDLERKLERLREERFANQRILEEKEANHQFDLYQKRLAEKELEEVRARYEQKLIPEKEVLSGESELQEKILKLEKSKFALEKAREQYESSLKTMKADVSIAEKEFEQSQYRLNRIRDRLENTILKAPGDGIVVHGRGWRGEKYKEGDNVWRGQLICEIPDMSELEVVSQVSEAYYGDIFKGQPVIIEVNALKDVNLKGEISYVSDLAIPRDEAYGAGFISDNEDLLSKVFEVKISLKENDPRLKHGMGVSVVIIREKVEDVLTIPMSAVRQEGDSPYVYKEADGYFVKTFIETGLRNRRKVVVNKGLRAGDVLALVYPEGAAGG